MGGRPNEANRGNLARGLDPRRLRGRRCDGGGRLYQGPITAPSGVVCPFEVTAESLFQKMRIRYHYWRGSPLSRHII
jgi:hypothetical protein